MDALSLTVFRVWIHLASMAPAHIAPATAPGFFADTYAAVASMDGTVDELAIATTMGACEGAGQTAIVGDDGAALGSWQLHEEHWAGRTRKEILSDRKLQAVLFVIAWRKAILVCGTEESALGRLATGKCGGAPKLSRRRLRGRC